MIPPTASWCCAQRPPYVMTTGSCARHSVVTVPSVLKHDGGLGWWGGSGRTYYVDHTTGATHWELPAAPPQVLRPVAQSATAHLGGSAGLLGYVALLGVVATAPAHHPDRTLRRWRARAQPAHHASFHAAGLAVLAAAPPQVRTTLRDDHSNGVHYVR
jgi:hypothetical protein